MTGDSLFEQQRATLGRLQQAVKVRAEGERSLAEVHAAAVDVAEKEVLKARKSIGVARKRSEEELTTAFTELESEITARYDHLVAEEAKRHNDLKNKTEQQYRAAEVKRKNELKDRLWTIDSMLEAGEKEATQERERLQRVARTTEASTNTIRNSAEETLATVGVALEDFDIGDNALVENKDDLEERLSGDLATAKEALERVKNSKLPKFTGLLGTMAMVLFAGAVGTGIGFASGLQPVICVVVGVVCALAGGLGLRQIVVVLARKQQRDRGEKLAIAIAQLDATRKALETEAQARYAKMMSDLKKQHTSDRKGAEDEHKPRIAATIKQGQTLLKTQEVEHNTATADLEQKRKDELYKARSKYNRDTMESTAKYDAELAEAESRYNAKLQQAGAVKAKTWKEIATIWQNQLAYVDKSIGDFHKVDKACFPVWADARNDKTPLIKEVPDGIHFGEYTVDQYALPEGIPTDENLKPERPIKAQVPAFLPFPDKCSVLLKARDQGRLATISTLQATMLRFLTGLPPGKVRFTIIDPVGLGENFAAFMHLADYDEQLVTNRIWTEAKHIEERLADLTEHMENVIQKYLRNQYKSIEEYNRAAGEVAEPYRVLVVANFPTNFTPEAARRLISIAASGPACGVCTLIGVDTAMAMPRDFRLADLEQVALNLAWKEGKFVPTNPELAPFPLEVDTPPIATDVAMIVKRMGEASKNAAKVEVPFEYIAPAPDKIWTSSTKHGFNIPIGRAGATRRQMFSLGKGTAQHALIAGKTGSGKSTLLHALITNLGMMYSPDEAELYLIDFKEGVEFKMYAANKMPHARVVAIQSEREFGLSILQDLNNVLGQRGEKFRAAGVNDVASYRDLLPNERLPRILLVVDEFQMFFIEDDKLAQEATLLLDRLVRQGRAFGVHVLLGSQTLGGQYALPRATIDQMAVRIALQCSDADAQLILSKDNNAARLLTRPGEAIYNDANGLVEGNDPFQVVWLSEERREEILQQLDKRSNGSTPPPLVFEGSASADIDVNPSLQKALAVPSEKVSTLGHPVVWLGDAVAIKDPTSITFRPQSGANLLLLGQQEEGALATIAGALVALKARFRPTGDDKNIYVVDGTPDDSEHADYLRKVCTTLNMSNAIVERATLPTVMGELAAEVNKRISGEIVKRTPKFVFVQGLQRLRELRKGEDDFGYGRKDKVASPGDSFATLLREGPGVGVHVIAWCDSLTNLNRAVDRQGLREFTNRVLFQMSANDSAQLIDTPAASKLGKTRALFTEEGLERPEKFRPYGLPSLEWLTQLNQQLR